MPGLLEELQSAEVVEPTYEVSFWREEVPVYILRERVQWHIWSEKAHENTYWSEAVQMQPLREIIHAEVLAGITLPESTRSSAYLCLQGEKD